MRIILLASAVLTVAACAPGAGQQNSAGAPAFSAAGAAAAAGNAIMPANEAAPANSAAAPAVAAPAVLGDDPDARGAGCVVFLGQAEPTRPSYAQASAAWRAALVRRLGQDGAAQLIGSSVNPLQDTPAAARRAAVDWCSAHPPTGA